MTTPKKPPPFRQMSFIYDPPSARQKRKSFSKQFSEDISDLKTSFLDQSSEIRVSLNTKSKKNPTDRPPSVKIAWTTDIKEEAVVIKKCKEVRRAKLTRHASLEKESILNSKQDLAERLRLKKEEPEKENKIEGKPNLEIFLARNTKDDEDDVQVEKVQPKYLQPLVADGISNKHFQIKKSGTKKLSDSPRRPKSSTIVVVPLMEKDRENTDSASIGDQTSIKTEKSDDTSGINVIIRPVTAQSRRERFQKRTNSAFHGTLKEQQTVRPPLVRSSSAPSTRPEKSKFLATKRKIKNGRKYKDDIGSRNNTDVKEWRNAVHNPSDIVTMVSLVSPGGSDNEEEAEQEMEEIPTQRERPKSVLKRESSFIEKKSDKDVSKNTSLRKTIKSVSFQQSSIHAIRSFSASFPSRRGSMATALPLNNTADDGANVRSTTSKNQEKRATNPYSPNSEERVPKRRLLRSNTEEVKTSLLQKSSQINSSRNLEDQEIRTTIAIDIQAKIGERQIAKTVVDESVRLNLEENVILVPSNQQKEENVIERVKMDEEPSSDTPKEKQCWAMYCKMTEKGINVSYDTLLRGLLTPTEYRMRRKTSIADEMNLLVNPTPPEVLETAKDQKTIE